LRSVAGVRETVVVAQARENDDPRLVAYCVGDAPIAALSQRASEVLPSYMRPSAYVLLESMPLNTNGKIDRARLPPPTESVDEGPGSPPRNDVEMRMAVLFQDVLNVRNVSIDRDFFALGGTSLEATELRRRIHREFGVELPLVYLFEEPSVERLAQRLSNAGPQTKPLVVQLRRGRSDAPPLLCLMGVTLYRELALALDTDRAVYGVHIPFAAEKAGKLPRIEEIAQKYTDLIAERFPQGPYHLTGLCFGGVVAFEVARGLIERSQSVATLALLDAPLPRGVSYQPRVHLNAFIEAAKAEPLVASANLLRAGRRKLQGRAETWLARAGLLREREPESPEVFEDFDVVGPIADAVVEDYDRRARPLPAPMLLFRADVRAESRWYRIADDLGWSAFVPKLHIHRVAGSHLEILREPQVRTIAQVLGRWINSGQATASKQQSAAS
jgi:thioesterase domain-containing protein/acyl carrier protein